MIAATNTVSATDAKGSPTTAINIEYIRIINPIKANKPKIIDLIANDDDPFSLLNYSWFTSQAQRTRERAQEIER